MADKTQFCEVYCIYCFLVAYIAKTMDLDQTAPIVFASKIKQFIL